MKRGLCQGYQHGYHRIKGDEEFFYVHCDRIRGHTGPCWYFDGKNLWVWGWNPL